MLVVILLLIRDSKIEVLDIFLKFTPEKIYRNFLDKRKLVLS